MSEMGEPENPFEQESPDPSDLIEHADNVLLIASETGSGGTIRQFVEIDDEPNEIIRTFEAMSLGTSAISTIHDLGLLDMETARYLKHRIEVDMSRVLGENVDQETLDEFIEETGAESIEIDIEEL